MYVYRADCSLYLGPPYTELWNTSGKVFYLWILHQNKIISAKNSEEKDNAWRN